jgi:catechol 2,3-dioxygenase-like lactoylglutathione lyase family enzyme
MPKKANAAKKSVPQVALKAGEAVATVAVKDVKAARKFYEGTLGFEPQDAHGDLVTYESGGSRLFVYQSEYAGTNKATAATWISDDVDSVAAALKEKGVRFEHYQFPNATLEGDVHVSGQMRAAWFKDPDGNILAIVSAG